MQTIDQQIIVLLYQTIVISCAMHLFCSASAIGDLAAVNRIFQYPADKSRIKQGILAVLTLDFTDAMIGKVSGKPVCAHVGMHILIKDDTDCFGFFLVDEQFAALMQQKISMKVDTSAIEQEIANYEKQLRQSYSIKSKLIEEIDTLDPDNKHYIKRKADLDDRLYKMYDKIEDTESLLIEARAKKTAIEAEKLTADNIYKVLIYFDKLYAVMDEQERRQLMESLISEIQIFEERKPSGQWLKSIKFKLPIIEEDMEISLDNDTQVETAALLVRADSE